MEIILFNIVRSLNVFICIWQLTYSGVDSGSKLLQQLHTAAVGFISMVVIETPISYERFEIKIKKKNLFILLTHKYK